MWKWKVNFKIEPRANPSTAALSPNGDLPMIAGFIVVHRRLTGAPTVTAEPPDDRRRDIGGASAENLVIFRGNWPVAEQSPGGGCQAPASWLYDMVEGQENLPMSCRSRKIGIRQKSTGHRAIYILLGRRLNLASHVLQMVFLGDSNFRFPFAHFPTHEANASDIYVLFWEAVMNLQKWGFKVNYHTTSCKSLY